VTEEIGPPARPAECEGGKLLAARPQSTTLDRPLEPCAGSTVQIAEDELVAKPEPAHVPMLLLEVEERKAGRRLPNDDGFMLRLGLPSRRSAADRFGAGAVRGRVSSRPHVESGRSPAEYPVKPSGGLPGYGVRDCRRRRALGTGVIGPVMVSAGRGTQEGFMARRGGAAGVFVIAAMVWLAFPTGALASTLVVITGHGWGNGVGMSQWGAEGYAEHGWGYERILSHYYPHTTLGAAAEQPVRVLLAQSGTEVTVGSAQPFLLVDARGRTIHLRAGALRLTPRLRLGGQPLVSPVTVEPGGQPLTFDGKGYRGSFLLERSAGGLMVVNVVPLERYLRGVVPSEMPSQWSPAAYQAQAVAARSYALASLRPAARFDLYADNRSQVYGGIRSERPETNLAVGATAGKVLTYDDRVIVAYYDSDSGGRTAAVQDVFPGDAPEPYLVSVSDPFDARSPNRRWQVALTAAALSHRFDVSVADIRVQLNPSGRASSVRLLAGQSTRTLAGARFSGTLGLRSTYFTIGVASLRRPASLSLPGQPVELRGFIRGLTGAVLQRRSPSGSWVRAKRLFTASNGRFLATVRPRQTTGYRLVVDHVAGPAVTASVAAPRPEQTASETVTTTVLGP
jgi:SpoIID/LytB domain protein